MGRTTGTKIQVAELQMENNKLIHAVLVLQERLEQVAAILIKHDFLQNTPYDRHRFVSGAALQHFPTSESAELEDIDGLNSQL